EQTWLLDTIAALVAAESPTHDKAAVDACGRALQERLERSGARVTRIPQHACGDQLKAEWGAGDRQLLILGHFDTVWDVGQLAVMPLREDDGRLHGPGVFDMKAGISLGIQAVRAMNATRRLAARVVMLLTTDEETGSDHSRALIEEEARRSAAVLVLEPSLPGGAAKTSRKGCGEYELIVHGIAAHAGIDPLKGASAIRELARQILRIEDIQDLDNGISLNAGIISGGTRGNVVPDLARAVIDVRVPTMTDAAAVDARLRALSPELPGTSLEWRGSIDRPPLERSDDVIRLYQVARQVAAELGHPLGEGGTGGGSDGNFTAALGIPTLDGLGATGDGAHALHEHVVIADLPWRAALVAGLLARLSSVS
ncbi:MAG: M20 family metallopeptidase, partial [Longimicrobiales bacterium]